MAHTSSHDDDGVHGKVSALQTIGAGIALSAGAGALLALTVLTIASLFFPIAPDYWIVAFLILFVVTGFTIFDEGYDFNVPTGHVGVPELFRTRLKSFCLAEGKHWLIPAFMTKIDVSTKVNTIDLPEIVGLSQDNILMRAYFVLKAQVKYPYRFLSAEDGFASLKAVAESPVREIYSATDMEVLLHDKKQKKDIGKAVDDKLSIIALRDFGIDVTEVFEPEIRPPANIEAEYEKIKAEGIQAQSEKIELDNVTQRVADLMKIDGMTVDKAYEIIQTERGKSTLNRQVFRVEGIDRFGDIVAGVLQNWINRKKS
ncbi:MAG: hypothetical protein KBC16_02830 [Candidatus Pacebacteria bacterium]|nr:hypothetical protein [Candidatus Paceibacterota bacterium]